MYQVYDGSLFSNVATVTLTVTPVNDVPTARDNAYTTYEDTPLTIGGPGVLANDSDVESDPLTAVLVTQPTLGKLTLNADGSFVYTPDANANGTDSFTYKVFDGSLFSNVATVTLTLEPVNDTPVAQADFYATDEDTTLTVVAPGVGNDTDADGASLSAVLVAGPSRGPLP